MPRLFGFPDPMHPEGVVLSDADHELVSSAIGPCHGPEIEQFLDRAPVVPEGRLLRTDHPIIDAVLEAVGIEVHGYMKLDEERDGRPRLKPKRGSTADRLLTIYRNIERHLP